MRGEIAFDPQSGAPLSDEREYPYDGKFTRDDSGKHYHDPPSAVSAHTPDPDRFSAWTPDREGALTTGEFHSTHEALTAHFRREQEAHDDPDPGRACSASTAFKRLKSATDAIDTFVWYAAAEKLHRDGHDVAWMKEGTNPRCPHCRSACKLGPAGVRCASSPQQHGHVRPVIHEKVAEVYQAAFGEEIDRVTAFDPPKADE